MDLGERKQRSGWVSAMVADLVSGTRYCLGQFGMTADLHSTLEERRGQAVLLQQSEDQLGAGTRSIIEGQRDCPALYAAAIHGGRKPVG